MKVLIAVADKHLSKVIVQFVKEHPWSEPTHFKVLHALEPFPSLGGKATQGTRRLVDEDRKLGLKMVELVSAELKKSFPQAQIENLVVSGAANQAILECAEAWQADLIVMGSHCGTLADRMILGSVPLSVAPQAHCSVAIVRLNQPKALQFEFSEVDLPEQIREFTPAE